MSSIISASCKAFSLYAILPLLSVCLFYLGLITCKILVSSSWIPEMQNSAALLDIRVRKWNATPFLNCLFLHSVQTVYAVFLLLCLISWLFLWTSLPIHSNWTILLFIWWLNLSLVQPPMVTKILVIVLQKMVELSFLPCPPSNSLNMP